MVTVRRLDRGLRQDRGAFDGLFELAAHQLAALLGNEARLGIAHLPDDVAEAGAVELAVDRLECRIAGDALGDFRIGDAQPQRLRALVQDDLGDEFADDGAVVAARACLLHAERLTEATTELLQPIIVDLAELLDGDLGAADLGEGGAAKAAKNVADSPDREADHEEADHGGHDDLAEPVGRGFAQTSKHAGYRVVSEA